jgi:hypothetical protein
VRVELYADGTNRGTPVRQEMKRGHPLEGLAMLTAPRCRQRAHPDYTVRVDTAFQRCGGSPGSLSNSVAAPL